MRKIPKFDFIVSILVIFICIFFIKGSFQDSSLGRAIKLSAEGKSAINKLKLKNTVRQREIVVFSTSWCGQCRALMRKLESAGLVFQELDIEADMFGAEAYSKVMGRSSGPVPVTVVGDQVFIGAQAQSIIDYARGDNIGQIDGTML